MNRIRVGIVGLGANTRLRHVPGLRACPDVEIAGICNRRPESTRQAAAEFSIPKTYAHWRDLVSDPDLDAVVIGTWPYLHCEITLAALAAGKHVLTEARMARSAAEAHRMHAAAQQRPELVTQIVPSPFGLAIHRLMLDLLADGYLGDLREVVVLGTSSVFADATTPRHWRQSAELSGLNMLTLGILHETLTRWVPDPVRVLAQTHIFTRQRRDPDTGAPVNVETPDSVQVLTELPGGARGVYHLSGAIHHGPGTQIHLYGSEGTLKYLGTPADRLLGARRGAPELLELATPAGESDGWRVEADFIAAIRGGPAIEHTSFAAGARYMEFTEAVARSAECGLPVELPLTV